MNSVSAGQEPDRGYARGLAKVARTAVRAPFTPRAGRELAFCLVEVPLGLFPLVILTTILILPLPLSLLLSHGGRHQVNPARAHPPGLVAFLFPAALIVLLSLVVLAPLIGRGLGAVHRRLARLLLGQQIAGPPPLRHGKGRLSGATALVRDGPGWRSVAYLIGQVPLAVLGCYAIVVWWGAGLAAMTYPLWWPWFRNHPPGVRLNPVPLLTPFGIVQVATFAGTLAAFAAGAAMVAAAPWLTRAVVTADLWLMRGLLGPGRLARRVAELERSRALAVDDSAALLRRVERDLHDGAQVRLATLAMSLGMAIDELGATGQPDLAAVRDLVAGAHRGAKDALADLRDLARGIHPPALDNGLADALATLAATSPVPVALAVEIPQRPTPAIESIIYFCAAELLANAVKHSDASAIAVSVAGQGEQVLLRVHDDGRGGADPARGSGLAGLAQRVRTVDGRFEVASPPGGPTLVTAELPLHA